MKMLTISLLVVAVLIVGTAFAETDVERENVQLKERLDRLEAEVNQLKSTLAEKPKGPEQAEKPKAPAEVEKPAMRAKYPVELYGFFKTDAAYMTARTNDAGNYARWVESEETNKDDDQFSLTARESRFGLMFQGPGLESMKTSGRVEVDFYEGGAENKARPMMRHAYLQLDWPKSGWSVLAGQTSDTNSPLVPDSLNYTVGWWVGNIGYRRPQIRVAKSCDIGKGFQVLSQVAIARTIGRNGPFNGVTSDSVTGSDTGKDSGFPTVQARYAVTFPLFAGKKSTFGVSGHYGQEEYDKDNTGNNTHFTSWSAGADILIPIADWLTFKGEFWTGEDLDQYLGGVGQGVVIETTDEGTYIRDWSVASMGGWGNLVLGPWNRWRFSVGYSVDNPDDDDVLTKGRKWNNAYWGQTSYDINEAVRLGVELSWWETEYRDSADGDGLRCQTSFIYRF